MRQRRFYEAKKKKRTAGPAKNAKEFRRSGTRGGSRFHATLQKRDQEGHLRGEKVKKKRKGNGSYQTLRRPEKGQSNSKPKRGGKKNESEK